MKIYLVEGTEDGRIYACMVGEEDAEHLAIHIDAETRVVERTLFWGQPPVRGYNE